MITKNFKQTEIGYVPCDWDILNLNEQCSIKARIGWQGLKTDEYLSSGDYYLITGTDFDNGFIKWKTCHYVSKWRYEQDKNIQFKDGDVLITKDGTIGKVAYIDKAPGCGTLNSGVFVIRPLKDNILPAFLQLVFKSLYFDNFINQITAGSTIVHLYQKDIVKFSFPMPSLDEQRAISEALRDIDELISTLGKLIEKKRNIKVATMQQLLSGKKRLNGFSGEWIEMKLGEIGNLAMCKRIFQDETSETGDVPFYKIGTFGKEADAYISWDKYETFKRMYRYPKKGDVLISAAGTIGRTVVFDGEPAYFQDSNIVWLAHEEKVILNRFLYYVYKCIVWNTENTTIARLYNENFNNTSIKFPSNKDEQDAIAAVLSDMDNEIAQLESRKSKYEAIKQGMMQQLLTGKIRLIN